ncbi:hypothetical protein BX600DRAFT_112758 [Xylariales sp. PMI_506]|nr:hypothetical protein BX600DRAFT_112758 [Xylariales sp. PMI_506]
MASHSSPADSEAVGPRGAASRKLQFRRMSHPRKRAVTACEQCRSRKIKCTNERPVCRSCTRLGAKCSYDQRVDHSSFDPASLMILDKLDQVLNKLDSNNPERPGPTTVSPALRNEVEQWPSQHTWSQGEDEIYISSSFSSTDSILAWPFFESQLGKANLSQELFIADHEKAKRFDTNPHNSPEDGYIHRAGIREDDIPVLISRFLNLVHTKNPILETDTLKSYAADIIENGLRWDAPSCLVLLVCALGAIAAPYDPEQHGPSSLSNNPSGRVAAEEYYQLARRRLGLLYRSTIACQCNLLCGIYQMYTMRPLEAWSSFYHASLTCALYLKGEQALQKRAGIQDQDHVSLTRQSQQRLYWTCLKSECELRLELDLPASELAMFPIPNTFPTPPMLSASMDNIERPNEPLRLGPSSGTPLGYASVRQMEEQSWFYYLSELAIRRIESRISGSFYKEHNSSWLHSNIYEMVALAEDFELQLQNWESTLPVAVQFRDLPAGDTMNELRYVTHGRYAIVKELIYRPFLYLALHKPNLSPGHDQIIRKMAQNSVETILDMARFGPAYHRHHGSWLACRTIVGNALTLLAASKAGLVQLNGASQCPSTGFGPSQALESWLLTLHYWEAESPDISTALKLIESLRDHSLGTIF